MDELMLDGNAVAGLLQELFAVEMTTALGARYLKTSLQNSISRASSAES